jgi:soluble lytic murein transglycosylase-like protein
MWRGAALFCLLAFSGAACADIYSFVDEDGTVRFSNVPTDPRYKLFLREPNAGKTVVPGLRSPFNSGLSADLSTRPYQNHVLEAAQTHKVDPALVHAVIAVESNYNVKAVSPKGALGLMQVMPATGLRYGVDAKRLRRPDINIKTGTRYLADLLEMFDGDVELALAGYNAGENAVIKYGRKIPPYRETQAYVPRVIGLYESWRAPKSVSKPPAIKP